MMNKIINIIMCYVLLCCIVYELFWVVYNNCTHEIYCIDVCNLLYLNLIEYFTLVEELI